MTRGTSVFNSVRSCVTRRCVSVSRRSARRSRKGKQTPGAREVHADRVGTRRQRGDDGNVQNEFVRLGDTEEPL